MKCAHVPKPRQQPIASKREVFWAFDAQGRLIRQATYDGSSGSYVLSEDIKFLSDGWRNIAELNASDNRILRTYVWGLDLSGSLDQVSGGPSQCKSVGSHPHY
jgi:YD repeat-containing protein